jgi:hypothetical protein
VCAPAGESSSRGGRSFESLKQRAASDRTTQGSTLAACGHWHMAPFRAVAGPREGGWPADWGLLRALAAAQPETTAAGRRTKSSALRRCRSPARRLASQHDSGKLADTARLFFSKEKLYASTFPLVLCLHFFKYSTYYRTVYYTISILLYKVKGGEKVPQHTSKAQQVSRPDII